MTEDKFSTMFGLMYCMMVEKGHRYCVLNLVTRSSDVDQLCFGETRQGFCAKFGGAFEHLLKLGDRPVEEHWLYFKETTN